jgi:hypothetical protein
MQSLAAKVCPPPPIQATEKSPLIPLHRLLAQAVLVVPYELNQPESVPLLHRSLIAPLIEFLLQSSIQVWPLEKHLAVMPVTEARMTRGVESFIVELLTWSLMVVRKHELRDASDCFYTSYG